MEIVFAYNHDEGSLRLSTNLHKAAKEELERIFARCVLGWDLPPYDPEQIFMLDHLKDSDFQLTTDPVDQIRVRIEEMRLLNQVTGRQINLWVQRSDPQDTIHRAIEEELNKRFVARAPNCVGVRLESLRAASFALQGDAVKVAMLPSRFPAAGRYPAITSKQFWARLLKTG